MPDVEDMSVSFDVLPTALSVDVSAVPVIEADVIPLVRIVAVGSPPPDVRVLRQPGDVRPQTLDFDVEPQDLSGTEVETLDLREEQDP